MMIVAANPALPEENIVRLKALRKSYLTFFLLMAGAYVFGTLLNAVLQGLGHLFALGGLVLYVFFCVRFARALRLAFQFASGKITWILVLVTILPFFVNIPLFLYDYRMYKLTQPQGPPPDLGTLRKSYLRLYLLMAAAYVPYWVCVILVRVVNAVLPSYIYEPAGVLLLVGVVLYVPFAVKFTRALRLALQYGKGKVAWMVVLVTITPFCVNVPFLVLDRRIREVEGKAICAEP